MILIRFDQTITTGTVRNAQISVKAMEKAMVSHGARQGHVSVQSVQFSSVSSVSSGTETSAIWDELYWKICSIVHDF